jgi:hypothetical protein
MARLRLSKTSLFERLRRCPNSRFSYRSLMIGFHPTPPLRDRAAKVWCGARRAVRATKAECPPWVQKGDDRGSKPQRTRRAESRHSRGRVLALCRYWAISGLSDSQFRFSNPRRTTFGRRKPGTPPGSWRRTMSRMRSCSDSHHLTSGRSSEHRGRLAAGNLI